MVNVKLEWEECVNQALVMGSPTEIANKHGNWDLWLHYAAVVSQGLADYKTAIAQSFKGPAGEAYQTHLEGLKKQADTVYTTHQPVMELLAVAQESLANAQATMPVPETMLDEVKGRSAELHAANEGGVLATGAYLAPVTGGASLFAAGLFKDALADSVIGNAGREVVGFFKDKIDDFSDEQTNEANRILNNLNDQQFAQADRTAEPTQDTPGGREDGDVSLPGGGGGSGGYGGAPSIGGSGAGASGAGANPSFDPSTLDTGSPGGSSTFDPSTGGGNPGVGSIGGGGGSGAGIGAGSGYDPFGNKISPDYWSGTGLAGAGSLGGGAGGFGGGAGGLGALGAGSIGAGTGAGVSGGGALGAGGGLGGAGALGGGLGVAGGALGKGVSMPMMPMGGAAAGGRAAGGGKAAGGGGGRGAGAGRGLSGGAGMMGGGAGAGKLGEDGPTRDSWLHEDEDVWGTGDSTSSNWSWDGA